MTPGEHDNAVEALAVLIGCWLDDHPDPCPDCAARPADGPHPDADGRNPDADHLLAAA